MWAAPCRCLWWLYSLLSTHRVAAKTKQSINKHPLQESSEAWVVVLPFPLHCWLPNFPTSECLFTLLVHGEKNSIYETTKCCFSSLIVETAQRGGFILYHLWPCWDAEIWLNSTDQLLCNSRPPAGFLFYQRLLPHSCGKIKEYLIP